MFVFGEHQQQDKFIDVVANDLSMIADSDNIKFYYGKSSAIFTFKSQETLNDIDEFLNMIFNETDVVYVLLPYINDNMSVKLPKGMYNHLFDIDNAETMSGFIPKVQELNIDKLNDLRNELSFINLFDDDDDDEILKLKNKKKQLNVDQILDKILEKGLSSLTDSERNTLENFSKTI
jgi:hypothetical protein